MQKRASSKKEDGPVPRRPNFLIWIVTSRCNLECSHCYAAKFSKAELNEKEKFLLVKDALQAGIKQINLTGGEVLLQTDSLKLIDYISELGVSVSVFTNGTTLSEEIVGQLAENDVFILLSIDGANKESHESIRGAGTWELAMAGAERLTLASLLLLIETVVCLQNSFPDSIQSFTFVRTPSRTSLLFVEDTYQDMRMCQLK